MDRWCRIRKQPRGAVIGIDQCWKLAQAWFPDVVAHGWRHSNPGEMQAVFDRVGLAGPFWRVI